MHFQITLEKGINFPACICCIILFHFYIDSLFLYSPCFCPCGRLFHTSSLQFLFFKATLSVAFDISILYHWFDPIYTKYCLPLKSIELFRNLHGKYMKLPFAAKK